MIGGIFKRITNSRIPLAAKELKWEIEAMNDIERVQVLYMATTYRLMRFDPELRALVLSPINHSPDKCKSAYYVIEGGYLETKKMSKRLPAVAYPGTHTDPKILESIGPAGVKLWMVTVGTRVNVNCYDDVKQVWEWLHLARMKHEDIAQEFYDISENRQQMSVQAALNHNDETMKFINALRLTPKI